MSCWGALHCQGTAVGNLPFEQLLPSTPSHGLWWTALSHPPRLQKKKSHIPFSHYNNRHRDLHSPEAETLQTTTLHMMNVNHSLHGVAIASQLTLEHFPYFHQNMGFDLGESKQWTSSFLPSQNHYLSRVISQYHFLQETSDEHHGSSAIVLGQTTWSTEGKMRLIKRKKVKPFIKFKNSVLQLSEVMSHSHLNSFLQH